MSFDTSSPKFISLSKNQKVVCSILILLGGLNLIFLPSFLKSNGIKLGKGEFGSAGLSVLSGGFIGIGCAGLLLPRIVQSGLL